MMCYHTIHPLLLHLLSPLHSLVSIKLIYILLRGFLIPSVSTSSVGPSLIWPLFQLYHSTTKFLVFPYSLFWLATHFLAIFTNTHGSDILPFIHHMFPLALIVSPLPFYRRPALHSRLLIPTFFKIKFLPVDLFCFDFVTCISVTSTLWCEVTASDGSTLHVFFPWHGSLLFPIHNIIYRDFISITALCYYVVFSLLEDCVQYTELMCRCHINHLHRFLMSSMSPFTSSYSALSLPTCPFISPAPTSRPISLLCTVCIILSICSQNAALSSSVDPVCDR